MIPPERSQILVTDYGLVTLLRETKVPKQNVDSAPKREARTNLIPGVEALRRYLSNCVDEFPSSVGASLVDARERQLRTILVWDGHPPLFCEVKQVFLQK